MTNVEQVLESKGRNVYTVRARDTLRSAIRLLNTHNIGAAVVCDGAKVVGIFSERDCVRRVMLEQRDLDTTLVSSVMTSPVRSVRPHDTLDQCMALMTDHRMRHLPVIEHEHLLGMISVGDVVKAKLAAQEHAIRDLESYINGSPYSSPPPEMGA